MSGFTKKQLDNIKKTGRSGYLGGEFFHTGYYHTGCDNELTERCRKIGKYVWCEEAKINHDHPVAKGFRDDDMDKVYKLVYHKKRMQHDLELLVKRGRELGFDVRSSFSSPRVFPMVHPSYDLRLRLANPEGLKVLNVGVGEGNSGIASQIPFFRFKQLDHLDIHKPYLDKAKNVIWDAEKVNFIHKDIRKYDFSKYDLVLIFDVLEHLPKKESLKILKKIKMGIIFIPLEKQFRENVFGAKSQDHLSLWKESDFKGFRTELLKDFHSDGKNTWDALWAIKGI